MESIIHKTMTTSNDVNGNNSGTGGSASAKKNSAWEKMKIPMKMKSTTPDGSQNNQEKTSSPASTSGTVSQAPEKKIKVEEQATAENSNAPDSASTSTPLFLMDRSPNQGMIAGGSEEPNVTPAPVASVSAPVAMAANATPAAATAAAATASNSSAEAATAPAEAPPLPAMQHATPVGANQSVGSTPTPEGQHGNKRPHNRPSSDTGHKKHRTAKHHKGGKGGGGGGGAWNDYTAYRSQTGERGVPGAQPQLSASVPQSKNAKLWDINDPYSDVPVQEPLNDAYKFFIANVGYDLTAKEVKQFLNQYGHVNFVRLIYHKDQVTATGEKKSRGYGFVYMTDEKSTQQLKAFVAQSDPVKQCKINMGHRKGVHVEHQPGANPTPETYTGNAPPPQGGNRKQQKPRSSSSSRYSHYGPAASMTGQEGPPAPPSNVAPPVATSANRLGPPVVTGPGMAAPHRPPPPPPPARQGFQGNVGMPPQPQPQGPPPQHYPQQQQPPPAMQGGGAVQRPFGGFPQQSQVGQPAQMQPPGSLPPPPQQQPPYFQPQQQGNIPPNSTGAGPSQAPSQYQAYSQPQNAYGSQSHTNSNQMQQTLHFPASSAPQNSYQQQGQYGHYGQVEQQPQGVVNYNNSNPGQPQQPPQQGHVYGSAYNQNYATGGPDQQAQYGAQQEQQYGYQSVPSQQPYMQQPPPQQQQYSAASYHGQQAKPYAPPQQQPGSAQMVQGQQFQHQQSYYPGNEQQQPQPQTLGYAQQGQHFIPSSGMGGQSNGQGAPYQQQQYNGYQHPGYGGNPHGGQTW